jgi:hypothetical protein
MWAPVLLDQVTSDGNLGRLASYIASGNRETLGINSALRQVVHTLGLPPLLGQTEFSGQWLRTKPSLFTWLSAAVVVAVVAALGVRWWRASRRKAGLVIMVGIATLAGLANGSSVPLGFGEERRAAFYHWAFVLAFFVCLVLGLAIVDVVRRNATLGARSFVASALTSFAVAAIVIPSAVNPALDRRTNTLSHTHGFWESRRFDRVSNAVLAHRSELGSQTVLLGSGPFLTFREALAFALAERGLDVRHSRSARGFIHDDRLVDKSTVSSGLFLQPISPKGPGRAVPGQQLAVIHLKRESDVNAPFEFGFLGFRLYLLDREQLLRFAEPSDL